MPSRPGATRRPPVAALAALLLALLATACGDDGAPAAAPAATAPTTAPVPTVPQPADPGPPGALLSATPIDGAPEGGQAWRLVYASTTATGEPVAVTGQLVVPEGEPPVDGWPVVAWGHPTTGTSDACAPSLRGPASIHDIAELTAAGVAVAATDFEGLGTEGGHPYLVGPAEGHDVLDAVRAARQVEGSGLSASGAVVIAGFSQGGHAALWAAQLAPTYAPELDVLGVQAVAPVTDVTRFAERAEQYDAQFGVLATIAYGFSVAYPELHLTDVLTDEGLALLPALETQCIGDVVATYTRPVAELMAASPRVLPAWRRRLDESLAGTVALGMPVDVLQGADDPIVYALVTDDLVDRLCELGDPVRYVVVDGVDHGVLTPERTVPWILARFAGDPAPSTCPS